jgi:hypothetical protein
MKREMSLLRSLALGAWGGAVVLFLISELLIFEAETHGLLQMSLTRRLSLPVAVAGPLIIGANFARMFRRRSESVTALEFVNLASASTAFLVLATYAVLAGTLTFLI